MKQRKRHSPTEIVEKLRSAERILGAGGNLQEVLQELQVSEPTYHRWRNQYGGMKAEERIRLKEAEARVAQLERTLADQVQDGEILRTVIRDLLSTPEQRRAAVKELVDRFGISERRACECVGQNRSTQRYRSRSEDCEEAAAESASDFVGAGRRTGGNGRLDSHGGAGSSNGTGSSNGREAPSPWAARDGVVQDSRIAARDRTAPGPSALPGRGADLSPSISLPPPRIADGRAWGGGHESRIRSPASSEE